MRFVEAKCEQGTLKLAQPLPLTPGERVRVIVVRQPDPKRWDLAKLRRTNGSEDLELAEAGLSNWDQTLDSDEETTVEARRALVGEPWLASPPRTDG